MAQDACKKGKTEFFLCYINDWVFSISMNIDEKSKICFKFIQKLKRKIEWTGREGIKGIEALWIYKISQDFLGKEGI
jgi:hypothetical protein